MPYRPLVDAMDGFPLVMAGPLCLVCQGAERCPTRDVTQIIDPRAPCPHTADSGHLTACSPETLMKTNVGGIDRILRIVLGLVLIALTLTGTIGVWGWIGVVPLATAAFGFCPLYTVLGFSSCPMKKV